MSGRVCSRKGNPVVLVHNPRLIFEEWGRQGGNEPKQLNEWRVANGLHCREESLSINYLRRGIMTERAKTNFLTNCPNYTCVYIALRMTLAPISWSMYACAFIRVRPPMPIISVYAWHLGLKLRIPYARLNARYIPRCQTVVLTSKPRGWARWAGLGLPT
jgi:hypothetical protein